MIRTLLPLDVKLVNGAVRWLDRLQAGRGGGTVRLRFRTVTAAEDLILSNATPRVAPLRILLVDDDPIVLKSLEDILKADGHAVSSADGGQAGIDAFREAIAADEPFQVVITDLGMPHVDGRRVSAAVKSGAPDTLVLLLTGWGQRLLRDGDIPAQVDRVLSKPPRLRDLREALALARLDRQSANADPRLA